MASKIQSAAQGRAHELPRVRLIPVFDPKSDADERKAEVQTILATMFANLHRRGRPRAVGGEGEADAA